MAKSVNPLERRVPKDHQQQVRDRKYNEKGIPKWIYSPKTVSNSSSRLRTATIVGPTNDVRLPSQGHDYNSGEKLFSVHRTGRDSIGARGMLPGEYETLKKIHGRRICS